VYLFEVVEKAALLYGFVAFRAIGHGALSLGVGLALPGGVALVGLLG